MDRFRIISQLGAGGFGEAFRAWDTQHSVPVVLKRPLAKHLQRADVLERFDREINRLGELTHPHIVPIVDHGHDSNGLPYLAMRFLPAGSLADRKKPQPFSFLHRWLPSVAAALDYVHTQGVVHRDVKPANIFFDTESQAYLGDFGIAKVIDEDLAQKSEHSLTSTGGEIGTYPYMGPEFFLQPRVLSGAYDQYALAITVYEMICGRRPFSGDSSQLIAAHLTQAPPDVRRFCPDAPPSLCAAVLQALAKKPTERFGTCADFVEAALRDVSLVSRNESVRRFLCPGCHRLVKVPTVFNGRKCRCPNCSTSLRVSEKLDALWLKNEDPSGADAPSHSARVLPSARLPELSSPDQAALQHWFNATENTPGSHDTADDEPQHGLSGSPRPSATTFIARQYIASGWHTLTGSPQSSAALAKAGNADLADKLSPFVIKGRFLRLPKDRPAACIMPSVCVICGNDQHFRSVTRTLKQTYSLVAPLLGTILGLWLTLTLFIASASELAGKVFFLIWFFLVVACFAGRKKMALTYTLCGDHAKAVQHAQHFNPVSIATGLLLAAVLSALLNTVVPGHAHPALSFPLCSGGVMWLRRKLLSPLRLVTDGSFTYVDGCSHACLESLQRLGASQLSYSALVRLVAGPGSPMATLWWSVIFGWIAVEILLR